MGQCWEMIPSLEGIHALPMVLWLAPKIMGYYKESKPGLLNPLLMYLKDQVTYTLRDPLSIYWSASQIATTTSGKVRIKPGAWNTICVSHTSVRGPST